MTIKDKNSFETLSSNAVNSNCIVIAATEDAHEKLNKQIIAQRNLVKEAVVKIMLTRPVV